MLDLSCFQSKYTMTEKEARKGGNTHRKQNNSHAARNDETGAGQDCSAEE